jgi:endonuclease/exonuclease/phosphatase family metal-dependent hydrolase
MAVRRYGGKAVRYGAPEVAPCRHTVIPPYRHTALPSYRPTALPPYRLRLLVIAAALSLGSCAPTVNLINPTTPVFHGEYGQSTVQSRAAGGSIRVVTFNLKLGRRVNQAIALFETNDSLRHADLIALQEMSATGVDRFARALRLNYAYYPAVIHPSSRDYFGPAILSPWPIERSWKVLLPHEGMLRHQRRTATGAIIQVAGTRIRAYATHLEMPLRISEQDRRDQVAAILDDAKGASEPIVIAGDFNSTAIGRFLEARGYQWVTRRVSPTTLWFAWDHIFTSRLVPAGSNEAGVVRGIHGASDHRPVWALLKPEGS